MPDAKNPLIRFLSRELHSFETAAEAAKRKPQGDAVHRLRVSSRKLRTVLPLLEPAQGRKKRKKLCRALGKIARAAAEERELEVAEVDARSFGVRLKVGGKKQAGRKITRILGANRSRVLGRKLEKRIRSLARGSAELRLDLRNTALALREWLESPPRTSAEFHSLRIAVKQARYALEAKGEKALPLKKLQDGLGRAHDLEILQELSGKTRRVSRAMAEYRRRSKEELGPALTFALRKLM
jgi:CHAD domain-containing protein